MDREPVSDALLKLGLRTAVIAVAAQTAAHFTWAYVWPSLLLNADNDWGTFAWASSVATFSAALAALALAYLGAPRALMLALGVTLALFSLDDIAGVHERLADELGALIPWEHTGRAAGMLPLLPLMVLAFAALWRLSSAEAHRVRRQIRLGLALLVTAMFLETLVSALVRQGGWSGAELPMVLEVVFEEGAELGGWIMIAAALAAIAYGALTRPDG